MNLDYKKTILYNEIQDKMTTINNFFDGYPIYYINLDRSKDRRKYMENIFTKYLIKDVTRIEAIDGKRKMNCKVIRYNAYTNSQLACTLSHIKAIKTAYENNNEIAVIMEDDVGFRPIDYTLDDIIKNAPKNWEYINLCPLNPLLSISPYYFVSDRSLSGLGTSTYIINRKGMKKILDTLIIEDKVVIESCATYLYSDILLPFLTVSYNYTNNIFYQNKIFQTEIGFFLEPV